MAVTQIIELPENDDKSKKIRELKTQIELMYFIILMLLCYISKYIIDI